MVIFLGGVGTSWGQEEKTELGIGFDMTYVTKYIWRGYDLFDDHGAIQPSVYADLFGTGFSVNVWGSIPLGTGSNMGNGGINQLQEYDYTLAYGYSLFEDQTYQLDMGVNYIYYDFPKLGSSADTQEIGVSLSLPKLINIGEVALIPGYYGCKLWPTDSGLEDDVAGGYHSFSLSLDLPIPTTEQTLSMFTDINYNDGLFGSDHDWSHVSFGISTSLAIKSITITPSINYQLSMDDSVNPENELYGGVTLAFSF